MNASAWIETNRSACTRRAFFTRSCSGTKKSASRVIIARMLGSAFRRSRSCIAICSTRLSRAARSGRSRRVFAAVARSIATTISRSILFCAVCGSGAVELSGGSGTGADDAAGPGVATIGGADAEAEGALPSSLPMNSPRAVAHFLRRFAFSAFLVADQRQQWVALLGRVQVEHQPVLVGGNRREREELRRGRLLQVDHEAHDARLVLADAHAGDERIVGAHLADQLAQRRTELEPSMSITSRFGLSTRKCFCDSALSDSIVTRV
jgi:hypothetical protein